MILFNNASLECVNCCFDWSGNQREEAGFMRMRRHNTSVFLKL